MRTLSSRRPVSWFTAIMSEGNNLEFDVRFPGIQSCKEHDSVASARAVGTPGTDEPRPRMALDQFQRALNLGKEFPAESGLFLFVPCNNHAEFVSSRVLDTDGLAHLRRISALIWRRTSSQAVVPASSAAHRRSFSAADAASTSPASPWRATSKLSIKRAAVSARSCSERHNASCRTLFTLAVMERTVAPDAKLTKRLQATKVPQDVRSDRPAQFSQ